MTESVRVGDDSTTTPCARGKQPVNSLAGARIVEAHTVASTAPEPWGRVAAVLTLFGVSAAVVVFTASALVWASASERWVLLLSFGCLLWVKLLLDRAASWSRFRWLPVASGLGLWGGAVALHFRAVDVVRARGLLSDRLTGALLVDVGRDLLVSIVLVGCVAALALGTARGRRAVMWGNRIAGGLGLPTLVVLLVRHALSQPLCGGTWSRPGPGWLPRAWAGLGCCALMIAVGIAARGIWQARRGKAVEVAEPSTYREPAPREPAPPPPDQALLRQLRWEVLAVAVVWFGLAPALAAARAGGL